MSLRWKIILWYSLLSSLAVILTGYISLEILKNALAQDNGDIKNLIYILLAAGGVTAIIVGVGGYILITRFFTPINKLTEYIDKISNLSSYEQLPEEKFDIKDELHQIAEKTQRTLDKARSDMQQALGFAAMAAHEIRTPLSIVRNQLEDALRPDTPPTQLRETIASTYDEILRLNNIVNDLLLLGTLQAGTFKLNKEKINFRSFLREFYDEVVILSREKDISIVMGKGPDLNLEIDYLRMRQVLFNLFENSLKHTDKGGRIHLLYDVQDSVLTFNFSDNGTGIPEEELAYIFYPFYKGNKEPFTPHSAGLGLPLVRLIIEAHSGSVSVESDSNKGTRFNITLPVTE